MQSNFYNKLVRAVILGALFMTGVGPAAAWTGPSVAPPGGNLFAPISVSSAGQSKTGPLNLYNPASPGYPLSVGGVASSWTGVFNWPPASAPASSYGILVGSSASGYSEFYNNTIYSQIAYSSYGLYTNGSVYAAGGFSGPGAFGGGFELTSGGGCYVANGITGGCSCPGYAPSARYSYYMDTNSTYGGGRGYVCTG